MYGRLRKAFHLVENGYATIEDIDRSIPIYILAGIPAYPAVMNEYFPGLWHDSGILSTIENLVRDGARGIHISGFYSYTEATAQRWEKLFLDYS